VTTPQFGLAARWPTLTVVPDLGRSFKIYGVSAPLPAHDRRTDWRAINVIGPAAVRW